MIFSILTKHRFSLRRWVLIPALVAVLGAACVPLKRFPRQDATWNPMVRVLVWEGQDPIRLGIRGRWRVETEGETLWESYGRAVTECRRTAEGLKLTVRKGRQQKEWSVRGYVTITGSQPVILQTKQQRRYRHSLWIHAVGRKTMQAVNHLPLEDYLKGVLQHETPFHWPLEALKAQAVAARTYVLYQRTQRRHRRYDVTATAFSQVYGGHDTERYRTNWAVDRTRGEYLVDESGNVLPAFYSACCGGHTEDGWALWNLPDGYAPLTGRVCPYCKHSPYFRWKRNLRSKDVQDLLNARLYHGRLGLIKTIRVGERTRTGRAKTIEITTRDGQQVRLSSEQFRQIVGRQVIKSNWIHFKMHGYYFDVEGRGWGHGVGLCQWGALGMAEQGRTYHEILRYYYPRTRMVHE